MTSFSIYHFFLFKGSFDSSDNTAVSDQNKEKILICETRVTKLPRLNFR
jgi:hypothetical protein